ncbi:hypothetical protein ACB092_03G126400 [Castanea dentata]
MSEKEQINNIKIAVIDSGINLKFSVFLIKGKDTKGGIDWNTISQQDTIIKDARHFCKLGHHNHDKRDTSVFDVVGHGTKCASVAAGISTKTKVFNTYPVTVTGSAPGADINVYKASWLVQAEEMADGSDGHTEFEDLIDAFKAAIAKEVDVISISLSLDESYLLVNAIAVGSYMAMKSNILTVAAAGNTGPMHSTVLNTPPWILTIGASESDKKFTTSVRIGRRLFKGSCINLKNTDLLPLVVFPSEERAPLESNRLKKFLEQRIVLCDNEDQKKMAVKLGAAGVLYRDEDYSPFSRGNRALPSVWFTHEVVQEIRDYLSQNFAKKAKPMAKIYKSELVENSDPYKVAKFSGRGPDPSGMKILKPDVCAPGVEIFVAKTPSRKFDQYSISTGTSFACPYVAGKAALIKREFEKKGLKSSPACIRSAFMTTAFNPQREISIFGKGAGFVDFDKALDPGLVYDCSFTDYVRLLCGLEVEGRLKEKYEYDADGLNPIASEELNYPSIMVVVSTNCLPYKQSITRELTCIGPTFDSYTAKVEDKSINVDIKIEPTQLKFTRENPVQKFLVNFIVEIGWLRHDEFVTHLVWESNHHTVTIPVVIIS